MVARRVIPRGTLSRPLWQMARTLAACPTVQAMLGVATADAALARIKWPWADDDPDSETYQDRPRVIVEFNSWAGRTTGINQMVAQTSVVFRLERPAYRSWSLWPEDFWPTDFWAVDFWPSQEIAYDDRLLDASNVFGAILEEVLARSAQDPVAGDVVDPDGRSYPEIKGIKPEFMPALSNPAEWNGAYFSFTSFIVELG